MKLKPGSSEAVIKGCTCPREDNGYGRGFRAGGNALVCDDGLKKPLYLINLDCPLHKKEIP